MPSASVKLVASAISVDFDLTFLAQFLLFTAFITLLKPLLYDRSSACSRSASAAPKAPRPRPRRSTPRPPSCKASTSPRARRCARRPRSSARSCAPPRPSWRRKSWPTPAPRRRNPRVRQGPHRHRGGGPRKEIERVKPELAAQIASAHPRMADAPVKRLRLVTALGLGALLSASIAFAQPQPGAQPSPATPGVQVVPGPGQPPGAPPGGIQVRRRSIRRRFPPSFRAPGGPMGPGGLPGQPGGRPLPGGRLPPGKGLPARLQPAAPPPHAPTRGRRARERRPPRGGPLPRPRPARHPPRAQLVAGDLDGQQRAVAVEEPAAQAA